MAAQTVFFSTGDVRVYYCLGSGTVSFRFYLQHAGGKREVHFEIAPEKMKEIAAVFDGVPEDDRGHAFWHYEHPKDKFPCERCCAEVKAAHGRGDSNA